MRLLLDEMYAGLKEHLEVLGWVVETAQEAGLGGARDRDVVEHAKRHGLILVTQDQRPAEIAELLGVRHVLINNIMVAKMMDAEIRGNILGSRGSKRRTRRMGIDPDRLG